MSQRNFDLMGPVLRVTGEEKLIDSFAVLLRGLLVEAQREPAFVLDIVEGVPEPIPADARVVYQGPMFWEGDCIYALRDQRLLLSFPDRVSLTIDPHQRAARIVVAPGNSSRAGATAGMLALDAAVDATDQFMVHAAGLTLPDSDEQVLLFARSGTGKTTTSLALAQAGFGLCADDTMVIRLDSGRVTGWGLPRDLKVHENTARMLPWLEPFLTGHWNDEREQPVARAALSGSICVEAPARRPVAGVFMLERGDVARSVASRLSQTETLVSLAADNVRTGKTGLLAGQQRRFAGLAGLASSVPTFKVTVGAEPPTTGEAILEALGQAARRRRTPMRESS